MQIVTDIPDGIYYFLMEHPDRQFPYATEWIRQGKPLPKGHGRLIDAEDVDNHIIGHVDLRCCPTIIEADKETEE